MGRSSNWRIKPGAPIPKAEGEAVRRTDILLRLIRLTMSPDLGLRRAVLLMGLSDGASVTLGVAAPLALKAIVDQVQARSAAWPLLETEVACLAIATLAPNLLAGLKQVQITTIVERLAALLSLRGVDAAFGTPEAVEPHELATALDRLPYALQLIVDGFVSHLAPTVLQMLASLVVLAVVAPRLEALLLTLTLALYALAVDAGHRAARRDGTAAHRRANALAHRLSDVLAHRSRVLANGAVALERGGIEAHMTARAAAFQRFAAQGAGAATLQTLVLLIGSLAVLAMSVTRVLSGQIGVGAFVLLQSYVFRLALPIGGLAAILRQSDLAFETLSEVVGLSAEADVVAEPTLRPPSLDLAAGVRCQGVGFGYADRPLLHDLDVELPPGSFTAIVGANGSGKSTLARLLASLLSPYAGRIELFGADCAALTAAERRRRILYVPQFVGLFDRTIGENGLYPPSRLQAAELAERLVELRFDPAGGVVDLDAPAGPNGVRLSGGQIQKLELARLTEVPAPALILDETTSALDPQAQVEAIAALRARAPDRLLILVTHARPLAEQADRVLFLEGGRIAGFKGHRRLMRTHPNYRAFWRNETRRRDVAAAPTARTTSAKTGIAEA
jgi:ATP-binding cassette subfamily B protein